MKSLSVVLGGLVLAHVALGLARLPSSVIARRIGEVRACERAGYAPFVLQKAHLAEAWPAIERVLAESPSNAIVLYRGVPKGAIEYAAALLWPRLCVEVGEFQRWPSTSHADRPVAALVLVQEGGALKVEAR